MDLGLKWEPFFARARGKIIIGGALLTFLGSVILAGVLAGVLPSSSNTSSAQLGPMTVTVRYYNLTYIDTAGGIPIGRTILVSNNGNINVTSIEHQVF